MNLTVSIALLVFAAGVCNLSDRSTSGPGNSFPSNSETANAAPVKASDRESVKNELLRLVNEIADASVEGDAAMLADITTEDFQLTDVEGKVQNKKQALADVKKETSIRSWTITEAELTADTQDAAVLNYLLSLTLKNGQSGKARITDTFSKQGGRWLLRSSQQTMVK
ncbi:MAG TPA: nuclear transport factor 2 family protein [Pyrinomonadaceae bacterium]|nr:nuclear transport factor 2 family protein [Pyrinomonadaceae bacterium]